MLEVAEKYNYKFDEHDFNFVAIRDRIRCYYKSYVQNCKKRGITVGYDAKGNKRRKVEGDGSEGGSSANSTDSETLVEDVTQEKSAFAESNTQIEGNSTSPNCDAFILNKDENGEDVKMGK